MNYSGTLDTVVYAYVGQLVAFTLCQLLLLRQDNRAHVFLWICSSSLIALSVVAAPHTLSFYGNQYIASWSAFVAILGGIIRYLAVGLPSKAWVRGRWANVFFLLSIAGLPIAFLGTFADYRGLAVSVIGMTISLASFLVVKRNRYWVSPGGIALRVFLCGMALATLMMAFRILTVYPFTPEKNFAGTSQTQFFSILAVVAISFFLQLSFTAMLVNRQAKEQIFAGRRNVRIWNQAKNIAEDSSKLRNIAEQRLDFIQLLTHEVRQPINNAQAALQSVTFAVDPGLTLSNDAGHALERANSSLDSITLALSNVILIGNLSSEDREWNHQSIEAFEILAMSRLDCSRAKQKRILITQSENSIFVECVPIFLRVALHNMLEHALLIAKLDSDISVYVDIDEVKLGVTFSIIFEIDEQKEMPFIRYDDIIIEDTFPSQLTNFGAYVASQVAIYHHGELNIENKNDRYIKFKIFIPSL